LAQIALFVVVALFLSCSDNSVVRHTEPLYTPRYAKGFSIEQDKNTGEKLLCIRNPWQGASDIGFYTEIDSLSPPKRIVAMSSSHAAMLDAVGCSDRIVGLSGCRFIYNNDLCKRIAEGEIAEVGYDSAFDFEKIRSLNADIVLLYGVAGEAKSITDKLDELRIPYIYIGDYLEDDPLGKAEWVVALASLCGVESEGIAFFEEVESRYNALREQKYCSAYKPRVMLNLPYRDTWFMPPHNSYMVRLIEDAGGEYILKTKDERRKTKENAECKMQNAKLDKANGQNSSTPISLEEALVLAMKADFWINLGQMASKEEVCAAAPRFAKVDAVKFNRLYNNTKRTNESRGSDFWESGTIRPDLILEDLIKILHYEAPTDSLYYYKKLN
jgi:iron complex transport system substrate-binding protein